MTGEFTFRSAEQKPLLSQDPAAADFERYMQSWGSPQLGIRARTPDTAVDDDDT
ncbi:hypothetical protein EV174_005187, partial [Coemansia sp. RSA 2320]